MVRHHSHSIYCIPPAPPLNKCFRSGEMPNCCGHGSEIWTSRFIATLLDDYISTTLFDQTHYLYLLPLLCGCTGSWRVSACGPLGGATAFLWDAAAAPPMEETLLSGASVGEPAGAGGTRSASGPTGGAVQASAG